MNGTVGGDYLIMGNTKSRQLDLSLSLSLSVLSLYLSLSAWLLLNELPKSPVILSSSNLDGSMASAVCTTPPASPLHPHLEYL